ncbi:hypothetical protein GCM10023116_34090 [Kistimonas scapharcae]|uniref:Tail specific protease domain-containing protein n=1 Tax=Kistimonas scapharcae TaxID=1036133 RepID=A0ABP8V743_9GAMM
MRLLTLGMSILGLSLSLIANGEDITITRLPSSNGLMSETSHLKQLFEEKFSYYPLFSTDLDKQFEHLDTFKLPEEKIAYQLELQKIIATYNDSLSGVDDLFNTRQNPNKSTIYELSLGIIKIIAGKHPQFVLMAPCEFKSSEGNSYIEQNLFDAAHPYLIAIDNIPVAYWVHRLEPYIPTTNKARIHEQSRHWLKHINQARKLIGQPLSNKARLTLAADDGSTVDHFVPLKEDLHSCPKDASYHVQFVDIAPESETITASMDGDIAYVPLPRMYNLANHDDASKMFLLMEQLRAVSDKKGMILDLRDNSKGNRTALIALYPFLAHLDSPPRVVNVMSYRLTPKNTLWGNTDNDHLISRFAFRSDHPLWSDQERAAIETFELKDIQQDIHQASPGIAANWYNGDRFSRWHYMVMSTWQPFFRQLVQDYDVDTAEDSLIADNFSDLINRWDEILPNYRRPEHIVVLSNQGTYSAAEILLSAVKGMDGVTILGSRTGGGSSMAKTYSLTQGTQIKLGSALSFTPEGHLYDNHGIEPDQVLYPQADDFRFKQYLNTNRPQVVHAGDSLLRQAIRLIKTSQTSTRSLSAGPIFGDDDALEKCPVLCETNDGVWNQQWTSLIPGEMAVCQCLLPSEPLEAIEEPILKDKLPQHWLDTARTTANVHQNNID